MYEVKVALVHDWLTGMRGGERCLEIFCELFPAAPIYTLLHVQGSISPTIEKHPIKTSFLQHLPFSSRWYPYFLPLFPWAIQSFDFHDYDLVISSSHCVAKGIKVPKGTCHLAYVYTPMRYIWDQYDVYFPRGTAKASLERHAMGCIRPWLQKWDRSSNNQVHDIIGISQNVAQRIKSYWDRESIVVHPPVNWQAFETSYRDEGFYMMVSSLSPYKRIDLAIQAANALGRRLIIIGEGTEYKRLLALAGPTVEFAGWQPDQVVSDYLARCRALIFPGEEDFGIVPLEAMSCGKPVIAYGKGGALETVIPINPWKKKVGNQGENGGGFHAKEPTGVFFYEPNSASLIEALQLFERQRESFNPRSIRQHAASFDRIYFKQRIQDVIFQCVREFRFTCQ